MANRSQLEIDRIDTMIITVGTRQVGWRSSDGIIRCLGADGDRGHPPHIDQLYRELDVERGFYESDNSATRWSVRDLGHRYYDHCREWLGGDFGAVELLLDHQIIADSVAKGLNHIILWATNQPETVGWNYRRADTCWLAQLMKGKIEATWKTVQVDVLDLPVKATDRHAIREEFEQFILPFAFEVRQQFNRPDFVLAIENKGSVPAIAESLEICAAALVREFQVINANPIEPQPLYEPREKEMKSARLAREYELAPLSEYFWPLERSRIISAWERGDFQEAQVWLSAHQSRYKFLYQLAGYFVLATNWEILKFAKTSEIENGWLRAKQVRELAGTERVERWRDRLLQLRTDEFLQAWEIIFLIELQLHRKNHTAAFMQFSQTVERLLYLRSQKENWNEENNSDFFVLIKEWCKLYNLPPSNKWCRLLHEIRKKRNDTIHKAEPVTLWEMRSLWTNQGFPVTISDDSDAMLKPMLEVLIKICDRQFDPPKTTLLKSFHEWGLELLRSELA